MTDSDENHLIAERRAKLAKLRERGSGVSERFSPQCACPRPAGGPRAEERRGARGGGDPRAASPAACAPSASWARRASPSSRTASGAIQIFLQQRDARRLLRRVQELGRRRRDRRRRHAVPHQDRRAVGARGSAGAAHQVAAAAARQVARHRRHGAALPAALRRPDHERGQPAGVRDALADRALPARVSRCARLSRGGNADAASDSGRRGGAALQDAPQCARPRHVPAHRAGAVSEAPHRRRLRAGLRDQPEFPQRRRLDAAQPRIHDARAVPGVCRLRRSHEDGRDAVPGSRRHAARDPQGAAIRDGEFDLSKPFARRSIEEIILDEQSRRSIRCRCAT